MNKARQHTKVPKKPTRNPIPRLADCRHPERAIGPATTLQNMYGLGLRAFMITALKKVCRAALSEGVNVGSGVFKFKKMPLAR